MLVNIAGTVTMLFNSIWEFIRCMSNVRCITAIFWQLNEYTTLESSHTDCRVSRFQLPRFKVGVDFCLLAREGTLEPASMDLSGCISQNVEKWRKVGKLTFWSTIVTSDCRSSANIYTNFYTPLWGVSRGPLPNFAFFFIFHPIFLNFAHNMWNWKKKFLQ